MSASLKIEPFKIRVFQHLFSHFRGSFLAIAECRDIIGKDVNISTNTEISMYDTLQLITDIMNSEVKLSTENQRIRPAKSEVFRLRGDNTKLTTLTNWKPKHSLVQGMEETVAWFKNPQNLAKYKHGIYNV